MKAPLWKRWLSYLTELHIESAPSPHNPHLYVSLRQGRYQLSTANAVYSYEDLYTNYRAAFRQIDVAEQDIREVLVLGLGLGSIPWLLERTFGCSFRYTAVELDAEVIRLAQKYSLSRLSAPIEVIQADAYAFMLQNQAQYDLICMDIFLDDTVPTLFESTAFLTALKAALSPSGLLLYNRLYQSKQDKAATKAFFRGPFSEVFPQGGYLEVPGNWLLTNAYPK